MKWVFLLVGLLVGTSLGLLLGLRSAERKVIEAYPEEVRPAVEAAAELLGEMDKEETRAMLEDIRIFARRTVRESDLQFLWQTFAAYDILKTEKGGGDLEAVLRSSRHQIEHFAVSYDSGNMDFGGSEELAKVLRDAIDREDLLDEENAQE